MSGKTMRKVVMITAVLLSLAVLTSAAAFASVAPPATATAAGHYRVTIENLTSGQPLSPPVATTHNPAVGIFAVGELASPEIEAMAENGDDAPLAALLGGVAAVTAVVQVGQPLTPQGTAVGSFSDTASFNIAAHAGDTLSIATMLICTNDGIAGLNRAALPQNGTTTFYLEAYDAGTEDNSELSADIVDPCSGVGPVALAGDPNGNENDAVNSNPAQAIAHHPGIAASGDLLPAHNWDGPIAKVTVTRLVNYRVTIENRAAGQPISPPVAVTHSRDVHLFQMGEVASDVVEAIAEDGNQVPAVDLLHGLAGVTDVVDVGMPLTPRGTAVGDFRDTVSFDILAAPGDRFSLAGMLICTNDGLVGLDSVKLPTHDRKSYNARAYDAGTEANTELSSDIVDPCSALGPVALAGDPNGNENDAVNSDPADKIRQHPGVAGDGDLLDAHDWNGSIAKVTITRLHDYRVTIQNLATGQPISPPVAVTHSRDLHLLEVGELALPEIEAIAEDGNQAPAVALLAGLAGVTQVVDVGLPLTPAGTAVGDFHDAVTFDIQGQFKDRFSLAGMLICTNDGFVGLDSARLPQQGAAVYLAQAYDAGTESNTELSGDIVDSCSALGPVALAGDPNGNEDATVNTDPAQAIAHHPGIAVVGDLLAVHGWDGPVAKITITRISNNQVAEGVDSFVASLSGNGEVPVVDSRATGEASFRLRDWDDDHDDDDDDAPRLEFRLKVRHIDNVTAAHIHVGLPNENGPVVALLLSGAPDGTVRGTITEADLVGPFAGDFAGFVEALRSGELYVNVHSTEHPAGEMRGQIGQRNE